MQPTTSEPTTTTQSDEYEPTPGPSPTNFDYEVYLSRNTIYVEFTPASKEDVQLLEIHLTKDDKPFKVIYIYQ